MFEDLLSANRRYQASFSLGGVAAQAKKGFGLVTCMDTRIEPLSTLGLDPGDAKIIRNAGGRVTTDVLRSLSLAVTFLGVTRIAVMQHTNCALAHRTDDELRSGFPAEKQEEVRSWEFLAMPDPDAVLLSDVERVRICPLIPEGFPVEGWRYSVETGGIVQVIPS